MIWSRGNGGPLTKNFHAKEFECKCGICREQTMDDHFLSLLQQVRDEYGKPLIITSAFRCQRHQDNLRKGGAETAKGKSSHEEGNAADIRPMILSDLPLLTKTVEKVFKHFSIGYASTFLHLDTRPFGPRRWKYNG